MEQTWYASPDLQPDWVPDAPDRLVPRAALLSNGWARIPRSRWSGRYVGGLFVNPLLPTDLRWFLDASSDLQIAGPLALRVSVNVLHDAVNPGAVLPTDLRTTAGLSWSTPQRSRTTDRRRRQARDLDPADLLAPPTAPVVQDADAWQARLKALEGADPLPSPSAAAGSPAASAGPCLRLPGGPARPAARLRRGARDRPVRHRVGRGPPPRHRDRPRGGRLTGRKRFVTLGPLAERLVVLARTGVDDAGRPRLVACVVASDAPGAAVRAMPPLPFIPEVPHGQLSLDATPPTVVLPGDGYTDVLKPFRTVEDAHVSAAVVAWLVGVAQAVSWPDAITEGLLVTVAALAQVAALDPADPATHRLGGTLASLEAQLDALDLWIEAPATLRAAWTRDRPSSHRRWPRGARLAKARAALPAAAPPRGRAHGT